MGEGGKGGGGGQGRHGQKPYDLLVSVLKKKLTKDMRRTGVDAQKAGRERKRLQRHTQKDMLNKCLKRCLKCGSRSKTRTSTQSKYFHAKKWYLKGGGGGGGGRERELPVFFICSVYLLFPHKMRYGREDERTFCLLSLFPSSFCFCPGLRVGLVSSDHARQFSNQCDICEVAKVVHVNWSDHHCNWSDTPLSMPLLQLH